MKWLRYIFEDDEERRWNQEHPDQNPDAIYYAIAPSLGALSLSFSFGWSRLGLPGAILGVFFLGLPANLAAIYLWCRAANDNEGDEWRLRIWMWSGWAIAILALYVWYRVFAPHGR